MGRKVPVSERTDQCGRVFDTIKDMCKFHNVKYLTYLKRVNEDGMSIKEALEYRKCYDHLGNVFNSQVEMCKHYEITESALRARLSCGHSLEEALTGNFDRSDIEDRTDHTGRVFDTIKEMCKYWNIHDKTYRSRIDKGYSKKDALTIKEIPK